MIRVGSVTNESYNMLDIFRRVGDTVAASMVPDIRACDSTCNILQGDCVLNLKKNFAYDVDFSVKYMVTDSKSQKIAYGVDVGVKYMKNSLRH